MSIYQLLARAQADEPVFINEIDSFFQKIPETTQLTLTLEQIDGQYRPFILNLPGELNPDSDTLAFVNNYICARIYNILSSLGGRQLLITFDPRFSWLKTIAEDLNNKFGIGLARKDRTGYGRCINVIDRMLDHIDNGKPAEKAFCFVIQPLADTDLRTEPASVKTKIDAIGTFRHAGSDLSGKILCGIDVGGTDIKVAAAVDGAIKCFKEYDWFPAEFTLSRQLIDPILLLVRLVRAQLSSASFPDTSLKEKLHNDLAEALMRTCPLERMIKIVSEAESLLGDRLVEFDAIGLCFPDVVVKNKVVGGEVYKTRGIRNNPNVDYEVEFAKLSDLDTYLQAFCTPAGQVRMTNDGPMASFTAAVEQVFSNQPARVADGVFAHTLGTELGTGWIDQSGAIPDIPLEVYNFIIDLGSFKAREFPCDDLRSINNFNTGLAGTLQKYASQSGAFRLAIKYFQQSRPDLYQELLDRKFVVPIKNGNKTELIVPTEPVDLRKPFLQYLMDLTSTENDPACDQIFKEIGKFLAVTWTETELILNPKTKSRVLFGRLVKNARCFELMQQGAHELCPDLTFEVADGSIANTTLMKQLETDPEYTVAQFAQAIGAIYFGNVAGN